MGFLFKKSKPSPAANLPTITGLQVQTSVNVLGIPIIYGSPRVGANLIWYNDFNTMQAPTGGGPGAGKGLLGGGKGGGGGGMQTTYMANLFLALGEGPISRILYTYRNQDVVVGSPDFTFHDGGSAQTPDPTVLALHPDQALAYRHTAYFFGHQYMLDSSGTVPQHNFVPYGILAGTSPLYNDPIASGGPEDADPAAVIVDILSNPYYGAGFPYELINGNISTSSDGLDPSVGDSAYQTHCQAVGFALSFAISDFEPAASIIDRILVCTNTAAVWNSESLQFIPYTLGTYSLNPGYSGTTGVPMKYYNKQINIAAVFYDGNVIATTDNTDPITINRKDPANAYNVVRITFQQRGNAYNSDIQEFSIDNAVELYGRREEDLQSNVFGSSAPASLAAQMRCHRNVYIKNIISFKTSWEYAYLDPMDFIEVFDQAFVACIICQITSIEEDDAGILTIAAEEV